MLVLPETERRARATFDGGGAAVLAIGATAFLFAINRGPLWGWSNPMILTGFVIAPIAIVAFVAIERRVTNPLLPLAYVRRANFSFAIATQGFTNFAYMGGFVITPIFLESVFGYPETRVGGLMIARPLAFAIAGPLAGYVAVRVGERTSAIVGSAFVVASMLALSTVAPGTSDLVIIGALALSGIGLGCSSPALSASIANAVDERDLGVAGADRGGRAGGIGGRGGRLRRGVPGGRRGGLPRPPHLVLRALEPATRRGRPAGRPRTRSRTRPGDLRRRGGQHGLSRP